jgi:hypothetical protein
MTDTTLSSILGKDVLPPELLASLQEAFDKKVAEAREEAELAIREELAQRYEHDKDQLVEAMDHTITGVLQSYEGQKAEEINRLREAQEKFHSGLKEARKAYRQRMSEHLSQANKFVAEHLAEEVKAIRSERKALAEARVGASKEVTSIKTKLSEAHNSHVTKIDEFVVNQLTRELNEFDQDRRALVETRAKLVAESRRKLKETQDRFVKESAKKLDSVVSEQLVSEMQQLHEDIERNRQNNFGRKIFEAMAAEFMSSYFAEGTETLKLQNILEGAKSELAETKARLAEAEAKSEAVTRKARLAEDRADRSKVMSELLSNLRGEKRAVMEGMLETIRTPELRKSFERFLPLVTETVTTPRNGSTMTKVLSESPKSKPALVTGDQRSNRLIESVAAAENTEMDELATIVHLAGIQKNRI